MTACLSADLQEQLQSVQSIESLRTILAAEGVDKSEFEIAKGLIAAGALARFGNVPEGMQEQLAQLILLAEHDHVLSSLLAQPSLDQAALKGQLASHGLTASPEVLEALSVPLQLNDEALELVVGGSLTLTILGIVVPAVVGLATLWINKHYDTQTRIAEINANAKA